ncbi:MAG: hypothetical protein ACLGI3_06425 [Actinomycetes bacterium]
MRRPDVVATEMAATLDHVGVPAQEHKDCMAIIETYRSEVVGPPAAAAQEPALVRGKHRPGDGGSASAPRLLRCSGDE